VGEEQLLSIRGARPAVLKSPTEELATV
jgi:hypothetical protein